MPDPHQPDPGAGLSVSQALRNATMALSPRGGGVASAVRINADHLAVVVGLLPADGCSARMSPHRGAPGGS